MKLGTDFSELLVQDMQIPVTRVDMENNLVFWSEIGTKYGIRE